MLTCRKLAIDIRVKSVTICLGLLLFIDSIQSLHYPPCPLLANNILPLDLDTQHALTPTTNKVLLKHHIQSLSFVSSAWKCGVKCLLHEDCLSFNYANTSRTCQLNDADGDVYPCHLVETAEFDYYNLGYVKGTKRLKSPLRRPQIAAECLVTTQANNETPGEKTEEMTGATGETTDKPTMTSEQPTASTPKIEYGPYNCSIPISGCTTFWMEPSVEATMKIEGLGDFNWTLSEIVNEDDVIANNQPCTDIRDIEPVKELYIRYRLFMHYRLDDNYYGFCMTHFNSTDDLLSRKCSGITTLKLQKIPTMVFTLQGNNVKWLVPQVPPEKPFQPEVTTFDVSGLLRYVSLRFDGIAENKAWHMCRVP